jgi:putative ABC transport system permease protein
MNLTASLEVALRALAANKLRSGLTMLGIIIGISAVIVLVSVGEGVQAAVDEELQSIGSNLLFVLPGNLGESQSSVRSNFLRSASLSTLTLADVKAIANPANVPSVRIVSPEFVASGTVVYGANNTQTSINGVTPAYAAVRSFGPILGRFIEDADLSANARVAVIGQTVLEDLFPMGVNPVDKVIRINRVPFRIIGVMEAKGGTSFSDEDDVVLIPLTTAQTRLFGGRQVSGEYTVSVIYAQATEESQMEAARDEITRVLRRQHGLVYGTDKDDFAVLTQQDVASVLGSLTAVLTVFLGLISAVSLLVGGIGIMNIMLVSVTERTREIGIRKAVGAKQKDILGQFLIEAVVLSLIGGLIGTLLGVSGTVVATNAVQELRTHVSSMTILLATSVSLAVGLFFGIYPAMRAARLDPIDALRYE